MKCLICSLDIIEEGRPFCAHHSATAEEIGNLRDAIVRLEGRLLEAGKSFAQRERDLGNPNFSTARDRT